MQPVSSGSWCQINTAPFTTPCDNRVGMSTPQLQRWQIIIVLAHVVLAVIYGAMVPPWEAHDETGHFAYVNQLVLTHTFPDAHSKQQVFLDQSHQPPLYYLVVAGLTFWVDRSDNLNPQINLFAFDGTNRRGTRIVLRSPGEPFPWSGTILALHMARVVSALLSGLMILLIALATRRLFSDWPEAAILATALAAFNPQVLFMAAMVNNDVMVSLMGAAVVYSLIRMVNLDEDASRMPPFGLFAALGVVVALSLWSKNSALILVPFTGLALVYLAWRQHWPVWGFIWRGALTAMCTLAIAFPFYYSNYVRYGQWIVDRASQSPFIQAPTSVIGAGLAVSLRDRWLPLIFINAFRTFWGTFGWGNVQMPDAIYTLIAVLSLVGVIGAVAGLRRTSAHLRDGLVLMVLLGLVMLVLPGYRAIYYQDPALLPGRYLMPALVGYTSILGFGWAVILRLEINSWRVPRAGPHTSFVSREIDGRNVLSTSPAGHPVNRELAKVQSQNRKAYVVTSVVAAFALFVPFAYIAPAYAPPAIQNTSAHTSALLTFDDLVQVTSVNAVSTYLPDREGLRHYAHVFLTWHALKQTNKTVAFGISILGWHNEVLGNLNVQPARGNYPSDNWHAGDTFNDDYYVLLEKPCPHLPALGRVSVSVYEYQQVHTAASLGISITHELQALDGQNRPVAPIIGRFKIDAPAHPIPVFWQPPLGMLDGIALRDVDLPSTVRASTPFTLSLTYETWHGGNPEGVGFVHLLNAQGQLVAQDDHEPKNGAYPTDMWSAGDCIRDHFTMSVPATATGSLRVVTGFYAPQSGQRFNTGTPDDLLSIGTLNVTP